MSQRCNSPILLHKYCTSQYMSHIYVGLDESLEYAYVQVQRTLAFYFNLRFTGS